MKRTHVIALVAVCLAVLGGLGFAWYLGVPLSTLAIVALVVICPLSHFIMMRGGHSHGHGAPFSQGTEGPKRGGSST